MISLEEVRQVVTAEFKRVHEISYSATLVNYENVVVVDIEHQSEPFVSFSMAFDDTSRFAIGETERFAIGRLSPIFYYQEGGGGQGKFDYMDILSNELCFQTLNSIYYDKLDPTPVKNLPGWAGAMGQITFHVVDQTCP